MIVVEILLGAGLLAIVWIVGTICFKLGKKSK